MIIMNTENKNDTSIPLSAIAVIIGILYAYIYYIADISSNILYLFTFLGVILVFAQKKVTKRILFAILLAIYIGVGFGLNYQVEKASHHGNTKHGWYSENNQAEQFLAKSWFILFPLVSIFVVVKFLGEDEN